MPTNSTAEHHLDTPGPVDLLVELGRGRIEVHATDTTETTVRITGREPDQVRVDQSGSSVAVLAPHRLGFMTSEPRYDIEVIVPDGSSVALKSGSADVRTDGQLESGQVKTGSGDVTVATFTGPALLKTGSGDVRVDEAGGELRVKSGSGRVTIGTAAAAVSVSTGSGAVAIGTSQGPADVKTGSGDLVVSDAGTDVSLSTGSGDLEVRSARRGRITAKGASGTIRLGIPAGIPVWTDITTVSGRIHSTLQGAGQPEPGADHVEVHAKTVSGDVVLTEI